ncbi:hypothetical protein Acr_15g0018230 [Actinidia rufa]|uniref:Uncharacterized protein n=1 Tax=Actinidia rufa TaxID=165716 RepID=A0A7J0FWZ3_9ERIC|nr:hypothetical protein Acr_15g0018230 [Actinidia rufa]
MVLTKHASNNPRGDDPNPNEAPIVFKPRLYKTMKIQRTWLPEFKDQPIIMGREFERSFPIKYYQRMLAPMHALGWNDFQPLPDDVYINLVRLFYCNLEVGTLENVEYTINTKVQGKDIVLYPTIFFEITGIAYAGECTFFSKPSHLDRYMSKKTMYEIIAAKGNVRVTQTKHLKKEFRGISIDSTEEEGERDEEDEGISHCAMDIEENLEIPPSIRGEFPVEGKVPMHGAYPSEERTSTHGGPPTWVHVVLPPPPSTKRAGRCSTPYSL